MKKLSCLFIGLIICLSTLYAQNSSRGPGDPELTKKEYFTQKVNATGIVFDGKPDDAAWDAVPLATDFVQFRSNLILRWEYLAGSAIYLVWSQSSEPDSQVFSDLGSSLGHSLLENSFGDKAQNIFLVKSTYRFLR